MHTCVGVHVKIRKHLVQSVLSFLQVASGSLTQVTRLVQQVPLPAMPICWPIQETWSEGCVPLKEIMGQAVLSLFFLPLSGCSKMNSYVFPTWLVLHTDLPQVLHQRMVYCV